MFGIKNLGFWNWDLEFEFGVWNCGVWYFEFGFWNLGFGFWGLGFGILVFGILSLVI